MPDPRHERSPRWSRELWIAMLLAAVTFTAYLPVMQNGFVFDDAEYILANRHLQGGVTFQAFVWACTSFYSSNWHPLTWLSHLLDIQLFGFAPAGHHFVNLLLHVSSSILLFFALRRLTGFLWRSVFVASLFALHPLHVESVAWVAERKDLLAGLFFMLILLMYDHFAKRPGPTRLTITVLLLFFGLLSKPTLVTVPFLLLLLDYWPLGRLPPGTFAAGRYRMGMLVLEKVPFFGLSVASSVLTFMAQRESGSIMPLERLSFLARVANAIVAYASYVGKMFFPSALAHYYPFPPEGTSRWLTVGAFILLLLVSTHVALSWRSRPYLPTGWLWYLGMLVPMIGLVQVGGQSMADRYTYLPLIGLFVLLAWAIPPLVPSRPEKGPVLCLAALVVLCIMWAITFTQAGHWRSNRELNSHALAVTTGNWMAHTNLAITLVQEGKLTQAQEHLQEALRINPRDPIARLNLGLALAAAGRFLPAVENFEIVLRRVPSFADAHAALAASMVSLGRVPEAVFHYSEAIRLRPKMAVAHLNLANLLDEQGRPEEAIFHYREALRVEPDNALVHFNLGVTLENLGRFADAANEYREALRIDPSYISAGQNLNRILSRWRK